MIKEIAGAHGRTEAQVTLRWLVQQEGVCAIPRTSKAERLRENVDIFDFALTEEDMARMSSLTVPDGRMFDFGFSPEWDR